MTDIRGELHEQVDDAVDKAEAKQAEDDKFAHLHSRIDSIEQREYPQTDLTPIHGAIGTLNEKFDTLLAAITAGTARGSAEAETHNESNSEDIEEEIEEAPKVVTQMTTQAEIEEKPPRPSHFLFRRLGGR